MWKTWQRVVPVVLLLGVVGCSGLRYSEVSPEARNFHPRRIAALPADTKSFSVVGRDIDRIFAEVLRDRDWFAEVVGGDEVSRRLATDEGFRLVVTNYLAKLANVSYSDPALSSMFGELTGAEAFFLVRVNLWNYTQENEKKLAKVGLELTLVEAKTGKTLWTAIHQRISDYMLIRPELADLARDLIREMIGHMPH